MTTMELDEVDPQWTEESRESFRTATADLIEAIRQHSAALLELTGDEDEDQDAAAEADELLESAATAYADTQFALTGTVPPLGLDEVDDYDDDHDDEDEDDYADDALDDEDDLEDDLEDAEPDAGEEDEEQAAEPTLRLTVLHRADFVVTDELAVIQSGKEAHHEALADDDPESVETAVDVADVGEALRQLHQTGGVEALAHAAGIASAGATTWLLEATELLDERDPDDWPNSPFAPGEDAEDRLLHRLDEIAG